MKLVSPVLNSNAPLPPGPSSQGPFLTRPHEPKASPFKACHSVIPAAQDLAHGWGSVRDCPLCKGPGAAVSSHLAPLPTLAGLGTSRHSANAQEMYEMREWEGAQGHRVPFPSSGGALISEHSTHLPLSKEATAALLGWPDLTTTKIQNTQFIWNFR